MLSISSSKSGMGIAQGQSVIVTCSATSFPPSRYTFYRNGTVVLENSTSGILTISSFTRNDIGNYSCFAKNEVSNATISGVWFFFVEEPPSKWLLAIWELYNVLLYSVEVWDHNCTDCLANQDSLF